MNIPIRCYWHLLTSYLTPQWQRVALLATLLGASVALQLDNPQILRRFFDTAMAGADPGSLPGQALHFIILALSSQRWRTHGQRAGCP